MGRDIVVFTLHKSASMFVYSQCRLLADLAGIPYHSPNNRESPFREHQFVKDADLWTGRSGCFAPIRFYVDIPEIENYDIILHLRDPRDVLVSMFYSYCFIHAGAVKQNTGYRAEVAQAGIDAFVLARVTEPQTTLQGDYGTGGGLEYLIGNVPRRYADYVQYLLGKPNVTLVRYEEMVTDYRSWLTRFIRPFPIEDKPRVIDDFVRRSSAWFPKREQARMTHVRQITPGDFRRKLQPSTIEQLNEVFADTLAALEMPV